MKVYRDELECMHIVLDIEETKKLFEGIKDSLRYDHILLSHIQTFFGELERNLKANWWDV